MISNYLKVAWRNLLKNKTFSLINIAGLAIGLSCFMLISLYVLDELSFDRYHEKAGRIYRIHSDISIGGTELRLAVVSDPMGATLKKDYPVVEQFTRIYAYSGSKFLKKGTEYINETDAVYVDSTFFDVFSFPAVAGNLHNALDEPNTMVISESAAKKYFGTTDVIGKIIEEGVSDKTSYKITAVIEDMPKNGHFRFDFLMSMDNVDYPFGNYLSHNFHTYLLLKNGADIRNFEKYFDEFTERYQFPQAKAVMQISSMKEFEKAGNQLKYMLAPLTDIHLTSDRMGELKNNGNIQYVYVFSAVAIFVLLIACINFMNLSTARSAKRSKEVGIRKVLGTERITLIRQFITESTLTSYLSFFIALGLTSLAIPYFNGISAKEFELGSLFTPSFLPILILLPLVVGFLAGYYPAFSLSSFKPIEVLKGKISSGVRKSNMRNVLVIFQFTTSIILIIGTLIIYRQLNFIQTTKVGFNKEQMLIIKGTSALRDSQGAFMEEVKRMSGVKSGSNAGYIPVGNSARSDYTYSKDPVMDAKNSFNMQSWNIDYDYIDNMGMEFISGRNFSREFGGDSARMIINESTAKLLGYENPVGKKIYSMNDDNEGTNYEIIGVVKNFHFESLKKNVGPLSFRLGRSDWEMGFRVHTANMPGLISDIESLWRKMAPGMPFQYTFMDQSFDDMYREEQRIGKVALSFAVLTILIACLGLFGLVTYMAEQRTKEIGIRKVLGASVFNVTAMISKEFIKLVLIALLIASPVAYFVMKFWLQEFAYRISISWWIFAVTGVLTLVIALLTVSSQSIRAALMNPVKSLRSE